MKKSIIFCLAAYAGVTLCTASAQTSKVQPSTETPEQKIARGERVIAEMSAVVASDTKKVKDKTDELLKMDESIENKIDKLVATLGTLKDSQDSGNRIENNKKKLIEGLQNSIDFYQKRRAQKQHDIQWERSDYKREDLGGDMSFLNERIDKRVDQIIALTQSFTKHEDYDQYIYSQPRDSHGNYYNGVSTFQTENPKYRHNKKVARVGENKRADIMEELQEGLDKLKRETKSMQDTLRGAGSRSQYDSQVKQIEDNEKRMESLNEKIHSLATPSQGASSQTVGGKKAAHSLELMVREVVASIQKDYRTMLAKKSDLDLARTRLNTLRAQLDYNNNLMKKLKAGG